jgi:hypothetical protein
MSRRRSSDAVRLAILFKIALTHFCGSLPPHKKHVYAQFMCVLFLSLADQVTCQETLPKLAAWREQSQPEELEKR